jgi:hypothetical protein
VTDEIRYEPGPLIEEAASLFFLVGGAAAKHFIIVGGLVPPLLVPEALDEHLGSADIDFCLSVAITEGSTRRYYRSIQDKIEPYFEPVDASGFRWRKREGVAGLPILLDFLAPGDEDRTPLADGTQELEDETAADNIGPELRPFPLRAGRLIDLDAISTTIEGVRLVYRPGARADVAIRHAGPVGFLAAKADALEKRDDTKDGYDVSWWCMNAKPTPEEVAQLVVGRPAFSDELFPESVSQLQTAFKAPDYPGPDGYARERYPLLPAGDDEFERARNAAYSSVSQVVEILRSRLWT